MTDAGPFKVRENVLVILIAAAALFDGSATLVAVSERLVGDGRTGGAV